MSDEVAAREGNGGDGNGQDAPLLDLLDALVEDRGRTAAARALGVSYATMLNCYQSRRVTRRMRQALTEFRDSQDAGGGGGDDAGAGDDVVDGDGAADGEGETLDLRVTALEADNRGLRDVVEELGRRVAALEGAGEQVGETQQVDPGDVPGDAEGNAQGRDWRPPQRSPGMPAAGAVTLEAQPDEGHAVGPLLSTAGELITRSGRAVREMEVY